MRLRQLLLCIALAGPALPATAAAQDGWGDLDGLLVQSLGGPLEAAFWLPDNADPAQAQEAMGVVYVPIPGAAGNTSIGIGLFRRGASGFALAGQVEGLFGFAPRDTAFGPDAIELTTTVLKDGEPRCCPSGEARWRIDRQSLAVARLR